MTTILVPGTVTSMNVEFRAAREDEHKELCKIAKTSKFTKDFSNRLMFSSPAAYEKGWIRVAEVDGKLAGFTCVRHKREKRAPEFSETMLYFITVLPEYRSLGLGELMINDVMAHGPHKVMTLNVMKDNPRAVDFYNRLGFSVIGYSILGAEKGTALSMKKHFGEGD